MAGPPETQMSIYAKETERLGTAARWLAAGLGGFAALLLAGVEVTDFGAVWDAGGVRAIIAAVAVAAGIAAFGLMIAVTARVFTSGALSLEAMSEDEWQDGAPDRVAGRGWSEQVKRRIDWWYLRARRREAADRQAIRAHIDRESGTLYGDVANSRSGLHRLLNAAAAEHRQVLAQHRMPDDELNNRLAATSSAAAMVVDFANYSLALRRFERAKRCLAVGVVVGTVAVLAFSVAVHTDSAPASRSVQTPDPATTGP